MAISEVGAGSVAEVTSSFTEPRFEPDIMRDSNGEKMLELSSLGAVTGVYIPKACQTQLK